MDYNAYLLTPHWQRIRAAALARSQFRCQICDGENRLQVHHRTYARRGHENPEDVTVLCDSCHVLYENKLARAGGPSRELVALVRRQMAEAL